MDKSKIKCLVVDDMRMVRKQMSFMLNAMGFVHVHEASDGVEALMHLKQNQIDLIISDWNMPNMTGIELLIKVRGMSAYKEVPFIIVTAETTRARIFEAAKEGVDGYLPKPFDQATFTDKVNNVISREDCVLYYKEKGLV